MTEPLKISLCTACKGDEYLGFLKKTLPQNMERAPDNVEFVVLSYGHTDGMDEWIKGNFQNEMDSGRLKYIRYPDAQEWRMSHAKNMAHRMVSKDSDVLCNLDADNFIGEGFCEFLSVKFSENMNVLVRPNHLRSDVDDSVAGRIAISNENFHRIRGYDNRISGWEGDDTMFVRTAKHHGINTVFIEDVNIIGTAIKHSNEIRTSNMGADSKRKSSHHMNVRGYNTSILDKLQVRAQNAHIYLKSLFNVNPDGNVGCGTVYINFSDEPMKIEPLPLLKKKFDVMGSNNPEFNIEAAERAQTGRY